GIDLQRRARGPPEVLDAGTGMLDLEAPDGSEFLQDLLQFFLCCNLSGFLVGSLVGLQSRSHTALYMLHLKSDDGIDLAVPQRVLGGSLRGALFHQVRRVGSC